MQNPLNDYQENLELCRSAGHVTRDLIIEKFTHMRRVLGDIEKKLMDRITNIEDENADLLNEYNNRLQHVKDNLKTVSENLISRRDPMAIIDQYNIFN